MTTCPKCGGFKLEEMLASQEKQCSCDSDARAIAAFVQGADLRAQEQNEYGIGMSDATLKYWELIARKFLREGKLGKL